MTSVAMAPNKNDGDEMQAPCNLQRDIFQRYIDGSSIFARSSFEKKLPPERSWLK